MSSFQNELKLPSYPLYHSKYETFKAVDEFMDRGFKVSVVYFCEHVVNCPTHTIQPTQQLSDCIVWFLVSSSIGTGLGGSGKKPSRLSDNPFPSRGLCQKT